MNRNLPIKEGMFQRLRLTELFNQGLEYPLFTIQAGPGYGKTQTTASTLMNSDAHLLWLHLTKLDNLCSRFWQDLLVASEKEMPHLAEQMKSLQFPDTLVGMDAFLRHFAETVYFDRQVIWVIDDVDVLENPNIINFFELLIGVELENFCLILISNTKTAINRLSGGVENKFSITDEELRFDHLETARLFRNHKHRLNEETLLEIENYTEGWPLALYLLMMQYDEKQIEIDQLSFEHDISSVEIYELFKHKFFDQYPLDIKRLLVKLAHLEWFTTDLMSAVYEGANHSELKQLDDNVFLILTRYHQVYYFNKIYRRFLLDNSYLISEEEVRELLCTAADHYVEKNYLSEAIQSYQKCGEYEKMLNAISLLMCTFYGITEGYSRFILKQIRGLSEQDYERYPLAAYIEARVLVLTMEYEQGRQILLKLGKKLIVEDTPKAKELLGEVYALAGALHIMCNQEDFLGYYQKASTYLAHGSRFVTDEMLMVENNHSFFMADNQAGAKERMERAMHQAVPWMVKVLKGGMYGAEFLFSAEMAFLSYRFDEAKQYAYHAICKTREMEQHDLLCNAHCLLARIALMQGDYKEIIKQIQEIMDYVKKHESVALKEIQDTILGWFYIRVDDCPKVPRWIQTMMDQKQTVLTNGRVQVVYANYLIRMGEFDKMIAYLEHPTGLFLTGGIRDDKISRYVMLAIAYQAIGDVDKALESLWIAYDMSSQNDLPTLFVEGGKYMRRLLSAVKKQNKYKFDPKWVDLINSRAIVYTKKLSAVHHSYYKQKNGGNKEEYILSKREQEVLLSLSQGLTREEIASFHAISINTVKSTITNIYSKFGAVNRADAIYIATKKGLLE